MPVELVGETVVSVVSVEMPVELVGETVVSVEVLVELVGETVVSVVSVELPVELVGETKERIWCEFMPQSFFLVKDTHHL